MIRDQKVKGTHTIMIVGLSSHLGSSQLHNPAETELEYMYRTVFTSKHVADSRFPEPDLKFAAQ